jgi:hypothetical protein
MTSTTEMSGQVVALARGMRELVRTEAAESERIRTLTGAIVDEMWASGLCRRSILFRPAVLNRHSPR